MEKEFLNLQVEALQRALNSIKEMNNKALSELEQLRADYKSLKEKNENLESLYQYRGTIDYSVMNLELNKRNITNTQHNQIAEILNERVKEQLKEVAIL